MTFGSFSTTNENSTIASLGSQRSDWGDGFNRPMDTFSIAPTLTKIWGDHSLARRLRLPPAEVEHHQRRLPGRPLPVQRRLHAREQRARR